MRHTTFIAAVLWAVSLAASAVSAQTIAWNNPAGGDTNDPANWSPTMIPQFSNPVEFALPNQYPVSVTQTLFTGPLFLSAGQVDFTFDSVDFWHTPGIIARGGSVSTGTQLFFNGGWVTSSIEVREAAVLDTRFNPLSTSPGISNRVEITGAGSHWIATPGTGISNPMTAVLSDGGRWTLNHGFNGLSSLGAATVSISGAGSQWIAAAPNFSGPLIANITDRGRWTVNLGSLPDIEALIGTGTVLVDGAGSSWDGPGDVWADSTDVRVVNGGAIDLDEIRLGNGTGSFGRLRVDGPDSVAEVGNLILGASGSGSAEIVNGGKVVSGGAFTVRGTAAQPGRITISGVGSRAEVSSNLTIREASSFELSDGATVQSGSGGVSGTTALPATAVVRGAGTRWDMTGGFSMGAGGNSAGELELRDGAVMTNVGRVWIGGDGSATTSVDGAGTTWSINGGIRMGGLSGAAGAPTGTLLIRNQARVDVHGSGTIEIRPRGRIEVSDGAQLRANEVTFSGGKLVLDDEPKVGIVLRRANFSASTGQLDLDGGAAVFEYDDVGPSYLPFVTVHTLTGRGGDGAWEGTGVTSSRAAAEPQRLGVGIAESSDLGASEFLGEPVDQSAVLARLTLLGDTDLDAAVQIDDFARLAQNFNNTGARWFTGDFNYDLTTDIADFSLMAANFNQSLGAGAGRPGAAVPEPTLLGMFAAAAAVATSFRRARR
jgi:T5SS/PEP-CTERM-associated repeat protein